MVIRRQNSVGAYVILMTVGIDNQLHREILHDIKEIVSGMRTTRIDKKTIHPVSRGKIKGTSGDRPGHTKFPDLPHLFNMNHDDT
jgi:hypothetical protein